MAKDLALDIDIRTCCSYPADIHAQCEDGWAEEQQCKRLDGVGYMPLLPLKTHGEHAKDFAEIVQFPSEGVYTDQLTVEEGAFCGLSLYCIYRYISNLRSVQQYFLVITLNCD